MAIKGKIRDPGSDGNKYSVSSLYQCQHPGCDNFTTILQGIITIWRNWVESIISYNFV